MKNYFSFLEIQEALKSNNTTCVGIVRDYLKKISRKKELNVFVEVFSEEAISKAEEIDKKIKNGNAGRLAGMVIGIKDNLCYKNHAVSASSKILEGYQSLYNATAIQRLLDEDVIIIGRLNCDEFAMGSANENSIYGPVKNPIDKSKVAGGSSGGSAAAVAAGLCLASLGSDTGGSIRQPASFCGVVGFKPTYSRVSRHGLIAYASSFDQIGPLTNNVDDAALILEIISGKDNFDSTVSRKKVNKYTETTFDDKPKKIAYIQDCLDRPGLDKEVKGLVEQEVKNLKAKGHEVQPISFPYLELLIPTYYILTTAEASSNLARYDGVRYGYRNAQSTDLETTYVNTRTDGFGEEVKRRIMLGTFVLSAGYHEAYFTKAQKIRRLIQQTTAKMFERFDFIISPTTPHTAFKLGEKHEDPTKMYLEDIFTVQANLAGTPAVSLPLGKHSNGMPIGIHLMADRFKELELIKFSKYLFK